MFRIRHNYAKARRRGRREGSGEIKTARTGRTNCWIYGSVAGRQREERRGEDGAWIHPVVLSSKSLP